MKITRFETFQVQPHWLFLKVSTDEGICGWGEPILEGRSLIVEQAVHVLGDLLLGQDPRNIEYLWQLMYRSSFYRGGPILMSAISGIEQALWDIKGKYYEMPVWQLLAGKYRDKIRMYAHITPSAPKPTMEELVASAKEHVGNGFTALKMTLSAPIRHIDTQEKAQNCVEQFAAVRETVGSGVDIAIDFHGRVSPAMAVRLCKLLEEYYPMFIEEPVLPENTDVMARVRAATSIPIAAGERLFTPWGFRELVEKQAVDVLQPDPCHCGGISTVMKIAAMGQNYYNSIAPHNPLGPIALAACLQIDTCIPNFTAQEHPTTAEGYDLGNRYFKTPFVIENGYIRAPEQPGLGFEMNEEALDALRTDGKWNCPVLYYEDENALADW
ncbi:MAG: galactonate dehydratase [Ruthenibacterium sp.]